jgi:NADH dehydrogenase FAD-containing subunit
VLIFLQLFCTGQKPNSQLLASLYPESINPDGSVTVNRFLQIAKKQETDIHLVDENIFVVGDTADAFGALQAGHTAWAQSRLASRNIARLVEAEKPVKLRRKMDVAQQKWEEETAVEKLERYEAPRPSIKVSLGLVGLSRCRSCSADTVSGLGDRAT